MILEFENKLEGKWIYENNEIKKDATTLRIEWLTTNYLKKITTDETGWCTLYINPSDNKFWELTYPESDSHGAGAPSLTNITIDEVTKKYSV